MQSMEIRYTLFLQIWKFLEDSMDIFYGTKGLKLIVKNYFRPFCAIKKTSIESSRNIETCQILYLR